MRKRKEQHTGNDLDDDQAGRPQPVVETRENRLREPFVIDPGLRLRCETEVGIGLDG